jgi:hypothetical protein
VRRSWCAHAVIVLSVFVTSACRDSAAPAVAVPNHPDLQTLLIARFPAAVYGASAVAQLPDGRLIVAEDEERTPLDVVDLFGTGTVRQFTAREVARQVARGGVSGLNDLEALSADGRGHLYACTSHALTAKGESKPEREVLVRFDVAGERLSDVHVFGRLKEALAAVDRIFVTAGALLPDEKTGLNIEGLAWDPRGRLLIGFRNPRRKHNALAVWLDNPDGVFERGEAPVLEPPVTLDLGGDGIRDLTFSPTLKGFLILAGAWKHDQHSDPSLWLWTGASNAAPVRLQTTALDGLKPEGIAEVVFEGRRGLVIVSDDGRIDDLYDHGRAIQNDGESSRFVVLPFAVLRSGNPALPNET